MKRRRDSDIDINDFKLQMDQFVETYNASALKNCPIELLEAFKNQSILCEHIKKEKSKDKCKKLDTNREEDKKSNLMILASNYYNSVSKRSNSKSVTVIIGPRNITLHWSPKYKKMIYILGEVHSENIECKGSEKEIAQTIENFLYNSVKSKPLAFSDIYIESGNKLLPSDSINRSNLSRIINKFSSCMPNMIQTNKTDKTSVQPFVTISKVNDDTNCRMFRTHYIDPRNVVLYDKTKQVIIQKKDEFESTYVLNDFHYKLQYIVGNAGYIKILLSLAPNDKNILLEPRNILCFYRKVLSIYEKKDVISKDEEKKIITIITEMKKLWDTTIKTDKTISSFLQMDKRDFIHTCISHIEQSQFVTKEIGKSIFVTQEQETLLENKITTYMQIETLVIASDLFDRFKDYLNSLNTDTNDIQKACTFFLSLYKLKMLIINIHSPILDTYLLSRIFKQFDTETDNQDKQRIFDEPSEPSNIIIYAGDNHANRCRRFLEYIGFSLIEQSYSQNTEAKIGKKQSNCVFIGKPDDNQKPLITQPFFSFIPEMPFPTERTLYTNISTYKRILTEYIDSENNPYAIKCKNIKDYLDKIDSSPFIGNTSSSNFEEEDICSSFNGLSIDKMDTS
jgi:hypothetical protein